MVEIEWAPRAVKDINEIAEFIGKYSIQYAEEQVRLFQNRLLARKASLQGKDRSRIEHSHHSPNPMRTLQDHL